MPPDYITAAEFKQFEKRIDERHEVYKQDTEDLKRGVKDIQESIDLKEWGAPPPAHTMGNDTSEIVNSASTIVQAVKRYGPIIALLLGALGIGVGAGGDTSEDMQEAAKQAVIEAMKEAAE